MKITVAFLLVAVSCCFDVASANCMNRCAKYCWQPHANDIICLTMALKRNPPATINAMAKFSCAYDRCKAMKNKVELLKSIVTLRMVTQCPLLNLLGNEFTFAELNADPYGIVKYLAKAVIDILSELNVGSLTTPCGQLGPLLTKLKKTPHICGVPNLDGRIQNGGRDLGTVAMKSPGLVPQILNLLLGEPGCTARGSSGLLGGLLGESSDTARGSSGLLDGLIGGRSDTDGGDSGLLGEIPEVIVDIVDDLPDILDEVGNTANELTKTLGNVVKDLDIGGITDDVLETVGSALGSVTGLLGGRTKPNKSGFYKTEGLVNENSLGNGGIPTGQNVGGAMSGGVNARYSANSDTQGKVVLTAPNKQKV